jgi:hypothetical protein
MILPLRNSGNIIASSIYLSIENDVIERKKHHFHASSVEKYFQNYIMKYTLTWSSYVTHQLHFW